MFTGPKIVTDGLVLYLDAANPKSYLGTGTTWSDLSGNGNHGTLINGPTFDNGNAGSIAFDGVNDFAESNNPLSNLDDDNSLTVSIFVNIDEPTLNVRGGLVTNQLWGGDLSTGGIFPGQLDPGGFGLVIESNGRIGVNLTKVEEGIGVSYESLSLFSINRQIYSYYSFTYNSYTKTVITYKNGIQQNIVINSNFGWTKNLTNRQTRIGTNTQGGWINFYKMFVGQVSIYNRALTQQEILQNYNATKSRFNL